MAPAASSLSRTLNLFPPRLRLRPIAELRYGAALMAPSNHAHFCAAQVAFHARRVVKTYEYR